MDAGEIWFYYEPGIEDGPSSETEDPAETEPENGAENFQRGRGNAPSGISEKKYRAKARLLEALLQDEMLDYQKTLERLKLSASVISGFEKNGIIQIGDHIPESLCRTSGK